MAFSGVGAVLFLLSISISISIPRARSELDSSNPLHGGDGLVPLRISIAEETSSVRLDNSSFILAANRTQRKDPTDGYKLYTGGWNISNPHYWASVGYPSYPFFLSVPIWFICFGFILLILCCRCCCRSKDSSYSRVAYALSLILLISFTCAVIVGSAVLYIGQGKFDKTIGGTLSYVTGQANVTVENLRNLSNSLGAAKNVGVEQSFLSGDVQGKIDVVVTKLNTITDELANRTSSNSKKIRETLNLLHLVLLIVASGMLILALLGLIFSVLGLQFLVYILVIIGWILVALTFFMAGLSLLFHNVISDTCVSMDEWINLPHEHTALDDILPCVDAATANESLYQSKDVTFQLVNVVNQVVVNISNVDYPPAIPAPLNYNQSGPLMPVLCNPYLPDISNRTCASGEVNMDNATMVWKGYICEVSVVSGNEICTTVGRLTPGQFDQMKAALSVIDGLYRYSPFLTQLIDCTFVRETFIQITQNDCPGLKLYTKMIYIGLALVSVAVMFSLIFWIFYARERRHRKYNKKYIIQAEQ